MSSFRVNDYIKDFIRKYDEKDFNKIFQYLITLGIDYVSKIIPDETIPITNLKQMAKKVTKQNQKKDIQEDIQSLHSKIELLTKKVEEKENTSSAFTIDNSSFVSPSNRDLSSRPPNPGLKRNFFANSASRVCSQGSRMTFPKKMTLSEEKEQVSNLSETNMVHPEWWGCDTSSITNNGQTNRAIEFNTKRSKSKDSITPKITGSPPPPVMLFSQRQNSHLTSLSKHHLDDREIKDTFQQRANSQFSGNDDLHSLGIQKTTQGCGEYSQNYFVSKTMSCQLLPTNSSNMNVFTSINNGNNITETFPNNSTANLASFSGTTPSIGFRNNNTNMLVIESPNLNQIFGKSDCLSTKSTSERLYLNSNKSNNASILPSLNTLNTAEDLVLPAPNQKSSSSLTSNVKKINSNGSKVNIQALSAKAINPNTSSYSNLNTISSINSPIHSESSNNRNFNQFQATNSQVNPIELQEQNQQLMAMLHQQQQQQLLLQQQQLQLLQQQQLQLTQSSNQPNQNIPNFHQKQNNINTSNDSNNNNNNQMVAACNQKQLAKSNNKNIANSTLGEQQFIPQHLRNVQSKIKTDLDRLRQTQKIINSNNQLEVRQTCCFGNQQEESNRQAYKRGNEDFDSFGGGGNQLFNPQNQCQMSGYQPTNYQGTYFSLNEGAEYPSQINYTKYNQNHINKSNQLYENNSANTINQIQNQMVQNHNQYQFYNEGEGEFNNYSSENQVINHNKQQPEGNNGPVSYIDYNAAHQYFNNIRNQEFSENNINSGALNQGQQQEIHLDSRTDENLEEHEIYFKPTNQEVYNQERDAYDHEILTMANLRNQPPQSTNPTYETTNTQEDEIIDNEKLKQNSNQNINNNHQKLASMMMKQRNNTDNDDFSAEFDGKEYDQKEDNSQEIIDHFFIKNAHSRIVSNIQQSQFNNFSHKNSSIFSGNTHHTRNGTCDLMRYVIETSSNNSNCGIKYLGSDQDQPYPKSSIPSLCAFYQKNQEPGKPESSGNIINNNWENLKEGDIFYSQQKNHPFNQHVSQISNIPSECKPVPNQNFQNNPPNQNQKSSLMMSSTLEKSSIPASDSLGNSHSAYSERKNRHLGAISNSSNNHQTPSPIHQNNFHNNQPTYNTINNQASGNQTSSYQAQNNIGYTHQNTDFGLMNSFYNNMSANQHNGNFGFTGYNHNIENNGNILNSSASCTSLASRQGNGDRSISKNNSSNSFQVNQIIKNGSNSISQLNNNIVAGKPTLQQGNTRENDNFDQTNNNYLESSEFYRSQLFENNSNTHRPSQLNNTNNNNNNNTNNNLSRMSFFRTNSTRNIGGGLSSNENVSCSINNNNVNNNYSNNFDTQQPSTNPQSNLLDIANNFLNSPWIRQLSSSTNSNAMLGNQNYNNINNNPSLENTYGQGGDGSYGENNNNLINGVLGDSTNKFSNSHTRQISRLNITDFQQNKKNSKQNQFRNFDKENDVNNDYQMRDNNNINSQLLKSMMKI